MVSTVGIAVSCAEMKNPAPCQFVPEIILSNLEFFLDCFYLNTSSNPGFHSTNVGWFFFLICICVQENVSGVVVEKELLPKPQNSSRRE